MRTSVRYVSKLRLPQASRRPYRPRLPPQTTVPRCAFHSARNLGTDQNDPADTSHSAWNSVTDVVPDVIAKEPSVKEIEGDENSPEAPQAADGADNGNEGNDGTADKTLALKDRSVYGSGRKRLARQYRNTKGPDPPYIPHRFRDFNVALYEALHDERPRLKEYSAVRTSFQGDGTVRYQPNELTGSGLTLENRTSKGQQLAGKENETDVERKEIYDEFQGTIGALDSQSTGIPYEIDSNVLRELNTLVSAGLQFPASEQMDDPLNSRSNMLLQCPKDGGIKFLDTVVRYLAGANSADLITIDPQDVAEMGSDYLSDLRDGDKLRQLSYDAYSMLGQRNNFVEDVEEQDLEEADEADQDPGPRRTGFSLPMMPRVSAVPVIAVSGQMPNGILDILRNSLKSLPGPATDERQGLQTPNLPVAKDGVTKLVIPTPDRTSEQRMSLLIERILDCSQMKRQEASRNDTTTRISEPMEGHLIEQDVSSSDRNDIPSSRPQLGPRDLIVQIRDYAEINLTQAGYKFLGKFHDVIRRRRKDGQNVLMIGTTSAEDLIPAMSRSGFRHVQLEGGNGLLRTIIVPCGTASSEANFALDDRSRTKHINIRHLQSMLGQLSSGREDIYDILFRDDLTMDSSDAFVSDIEEAIWSSERVNRIATIALGLLKPGDVMTGKHIVAALNMIHKSDEAKYDWISEDREYSKKHTKSTSLPGPDKISEQRLQKLRKTCNSYEKKLLHGVVDAAGIRTTFADVRAPSETIEALKTLTSLSLIRPEAFTYGVLATDKIPGLLLYGPPGTGKTLLAKAVAKESGATVLEISGSDVYDMYVGEGEKNVRAIFSLAKKLTPCVVFIDEADAIFGSRGTSSNRTSHRELINQFLREWDGMNDLSAFIMVATNRPFDLDDAVLRRLPRRLLVDLPNEKDREAILKIHLKDEVLQPDVSLSDLASRTPLYSGSDLKNVAVAAALACVRDENDAAVASKVAAPGKPYTYPELRTLEPRHFTKAMEEISASISDDMSSLTAIKKFDERFGDRRGRRKKAGGYGFETLTEKERELAGADAARVRRQS